jgi:hypothetical protein
MNKLQVYFVQTGITNGENTFQYRLELNKRHGDLTPELAEKVVCGALGKFFHFVGVLKFCKGKGVNLAMPFNFIITKGEDERNEIPLFDSMELHESLTATMKLQNTCKSRKRFAAKAVQLMKFAAMDLQLQSLEELVDSIGND